MDDRKRKKSTTQEGSPDPMFEVIPQEDTAETSAGDDEERREGWALNWDATALAELPHPRLPISR